MAWAFAAALEFQALWLCAPREPLSRNLGGWSTAATATKLSSVFAVGVECTGHETRSSMQERHGWDSRSRRSPDLETLHIAKHFPNTPGDFLPP